MVITLGLIFGGALAFATPDEIDGILLRAGIVSVVLCAAGLYVARH